ncbi:MAG: HEPN domain-containing protein [Bacteroidetes bacterium]|nr:HEPN domain-containing protein [Bacteroidota bacterium]
MSEWDIELVKLWYEKSLKAYKTAKQLFKDEDYDATLNRTYYSAFYSVVALLMSRNIKFKTHKSAKNMLHQHFIQTGQLPVEFGKYYNEIFNYRQEADYEAVSEINPESIPMLLEILDKFIKEIRNLLPIC